MNPFHLSGAIATPLQKGTMLLEASAGTGKTFTIAGIVTRLVLEHDIPLERIAVMTFTIAATSELRDRIRARLAQVDRALGGDISSLDEFSTWIQSSFNALSMRDQVRWQQRLRRALASVDAAPITTIHSFARRVAGDHAASVGIDPAAAVTVDINDWREEVVRDWFRIHLQNADSLVVGLLGKDPLKDLLQVAKKTETHPHAAIMTQPLDVTTVVTRYHHAAAWWAEYKPQLIAHVTQYLSGINKNYIFHPDKLSGRVGTIEKILAGSIRDSDSKVKELKDWWNADKLEKIGAIEGFDPSFFTRIPEHLPQIDILRGGLHAAFAHHYRATFLDRTAHVNDLHVNDVLVALHAALLRDNSKALSKRIGSRYQAVLVDEFQDTDLLQWQIMEGCFAQGQHYLVLIGDPKQAIYAFRGADVYAYTVAKERVDSDRQFTLHCNFRTDKPLVNALHALYLESNGMPAVSDPFAVSGIAYHRVDADKPVRIQPGLLEPDPLLIVNLDPGFCGNAAQAVLATAEAVSHEIGRLLDMTNGVQLKREKGVFTPIAPGDIAVLVRTHKQALKVYNSLNARGIPAVRQDQSSVFASESAAELQAFIASCLDPLREVTLRSAAATRYIGASAAELIAEPQNALMSALPLLLARCGEVLKNNGIATWWYHVYDIDFGWGTPRQRLSAIPDNGRMIMDTMHIIELMAAESNLAPLAMADWLGQQRAEEDPSDARTRRLERDDAAVRIVTVHVSKGLQYPIVFEAFAWQGVSDLKLPLLIHAHDGSSAEQYLVEPHDSIMAQAEREALGDDLRKLYVGLTRAMHRLYVVWATVPPAKSKTSYGSTTSALAWLLCGRHVAPPTVASRLDAVRDRYSQGLTIPTNVGITVYTPDVSIINNGSGIVPAVPSSFDRDTITISHLERYWTRCSFTGLSRRAVHRDSSIDDEYDHDQSTPHVLRDDDEAPGGAALGTLVHTLFQHADLVAWKNNPQTVIDVLSKQAQRDGVELTQAQTIKLAMSMRRAVVQCIPDIGIAIADLPQSAVAREWPIRVAIHHESVPLATIFHGRTPRAPHWPHTLQRVTLPAGVFTGVLDALVCVDGRFHLIDWKTNLLESYDDEALWSSMADQQYLLQAHLYLLAVHRFLRWRLKEYEPAIHLGVAAYAYLRGTRDGDSRAGWAVVKPDLSILEALDAHG